MKARIIATEISAALLFAGTLRAANGGGHGLHPRRASPFSVHRQKHFDRASDVGPHFPFWRSLPVRLHQAMKMIMRHHRAEEKSRRAGRILAT
jgi:hypothetical protein